MAGFVSEHARTHPPGLILANWLTIRIFATVPALAAPLAQYVWPLRCTDLWLLNRPPEVAAALGIWSLLPLLAAALTALPAFVLAKLLLNDRSVRLATILAATMPALLLLRVVELPDRGLSLSRSTAWLLAGAGLLAGLFWLIGMSVLRSWRNRKTPDAGALLSSGIGLSYVLLPLIHHLLATPPAYRYISAAGNFFAFSWAVQLVAFVVAAGMAFVTVQARHWLERRRSG